jgi:hypothetical protein
MMKTNKMLPLATALSLLNGCVSLSVHHQQGQSPPLSSGSPYYLPFEQFEITATRTLTGCNANGSFGIKYGVTVTPSQQNDPAQLYEIDTASLSSIFKNSDLKTAFYPNGLLQQFNGAAEDRTSQAIVNVVTGLGTIAETIVTYGTGGTAQQDCLDTLKGDVKEALTQLHPDNGPKARQTPSVNDGVTAKTNVLKAATAELAALQGVAAAMGGRLDAATQSRMIAAALAVNRATSAVATASKPATAAQAKLTATTSFRWPASGDLADTANHLALVPDGDAALAQWMTKPPPAEELQAGYFVVSLELMDATGQPLAPSKPAIVATDFSGLVYRTPIQGYLRLCASDKPAKEKPPTGAFPVCGQPQTTLPSASSVIWAGALPQAGRLRIMPYANKLFQNNTLAANFGTDGSLSSVEYQNKTSALETATSTLSQAATAAAAAAKTITGASTDRLNTEAANINAQTAVVNARTGLQAASTNAATALANAQVAQITATNNLVTAQAGIPFVQQVGVLQANTALANAQAATTNAQLLELTAAKALAAAQSAAR